MALDRSADHPQRVDLGILGQDVQIDCRDLAVRKVLLGNFGALVSPARSAFPDLSYVITRDAASGVLELSRRDSATLSFREVGELVFHLEKDITIALQQRRPELLFLHAAALEQSGRAYVFAGDSGHGKSTTTWGLLHHGFRYLSDELCPIDLERFQVHPYPHALCLKRRPPSAYPLPEDALLDLGATLHVPVPALPGIVSSSPVDLAAIFFLRYNGGLSRPEIREISPAEGAARLYVTTLNALAHPDRGLDAVMRVALRARCFVLESAGLQATCELVGECIAGIGHGDQPVPGPTRVAGGLPSRALARGGATRD